MYAMDYADARVIAPKAPVKAWRHLIADLDCDPLFDLSEGLATSHDGKAMRPDRDALRQAEGFVQGDMSTAELMTWAYRAAAATEGQSEYRLLTAAVVLRAFLREALLEQRRAERKHTKFMRRIRKTMVVVPFRPAASRKSAPVFGTSEEFALAA